MSTCETLDRVKVMGGTLDRVRPICETLDMVRVIVGILDKVTSI